MAWEPVYLRVSFSEHRSGVALENLGGAVALCRTGAMDTTVSPYYTKRIARLLEAAGVRTSLSIVPGKVMVESV